MNRLERAILFSMTVGALAISLKAQSTPAVHGSGTTSTVPLWTGTSTIGNSALAQSGSNITASGSITATSFAGNGSSLSNVNAATLGSLPASSFAQLGASNNLFVGNVSAGATLSGYTINSGNGGFQFAGTQVLSILPGLFNLYVGQSSGQGSGTGNTGSQNTSVGYQTLFLNTSGGSNTAVGTSSLYNNTTGNDNTAVGNFSLNSNTTGTVNTAAGNNTLIGNTTGSANVAAGDGALFSNSAGSRNIAVGRLSLGGLATGNNNTALGNNAGGGFAGDESNNIDINNGGVAGESGVIRIGDSSTQTAAFIAGINGVTTGSSSTSTVLIDSNGQLGTIASSRRYKEDIHDMGEASDGLLRLRPVVFRYKMPYADGSKPIQYGLVAEEVAQVYPDLVVRGKDGQLETVQYYKLDAMLLNEMQKLAKEHSVDREEISKLQDQIQEQQKQAWDLEASMKKLLDQVQLLKAMLDHERSLQVDAAAWVSSVSAHEQK